MNASHLQGKKIPLNGQKSAIRTNPTIGRCNALCRFLLPLILLTFSLASCGPVDLNAPVPTFDTGVDPNAWAQIPAGEFYYGQHEDIESTDAYEIMITDVTVGQYAKFLTEARATGDIKLISETESVVGYYPGDKFNGVKHEEKIEAGDWLYIPLDDPSQKIKFTSKITFGAKEGFENHPMTVVTWFGALGYCQYYGWRLPTEKEWEKAARGPSTPSQGQAGSGPTRPFPWGDEITRENANFYASRDPFEDMRNFGSRTSPVGFYNGQKYGDYQTLDSASPYGLYDMAGNVWQWTGDVYEGMHYRFMRGGSKDTYDMDLRIWVRNNATPTYFSPGVGFRCVR
jgi:formylglycine-generating enzyme required for sulfatase activity